MTPGRFITFEGIDGAGKSSHLKWLAAYIGERGMEVVSTREPGGTPLGETLRELVLHQAMDGETEALIMFAARSEHLALVIRPALARGAWVLSDRFTDASFAYQCGGRGLSAAKLAGLEAWVHGDLQPDATFLFNLDPALAYERQRAASREPDRFEREQVDFFRRVRDHYLDRARAFPKRIHVIDAAGSLEEVRARLATAFDKAFA